MSTVLDRSGGKFVFLWIKAEQSMRPKQSLDKVVGIEFVAGRFYVK